MLNIICVNHRDYLGRGAEYVAKLRAGVASNLTLPARWVTVTERHVPDGIEGWWSKLAMFRPGFLEGRCLFFDLDTVITGSLDDLASYPGPFAALDDFLAPGQLQSSVMAWEAGEMDDVWLRWEAAGFPQFDPRGDQAWIDEMRPEAVRLQDEFPDQIVSFKAHCARGVPHDARAVCFHGLPRPHAMAELMNHWR